MKIKDQWKLAWRMGRMLAKKLIAGEEWENATKDIQLGIVLQSSICWIDRNDWQDQSVRRWLKRGIRRQLP